MDPTSALGKTTGEWSAISIFMFLHLFNMAEGEKACANILKLLKPKEGSLVIGANMGTIEPREMTLKPPMCEPGENKTLYCHSKETLIELWERVAGRIGIKIKVSADYDKQDMEEREKDAQQHKDRFFGENGDTERKINFLVELI